MFKIKHFGLFFVFALMGIICVNAQSLLNRTIQSLPDYFNKKDIIKSQRLVATVNTDSLALESDTTKYLFHYYAAAIDEIQNVDTEQKAEHLRIAKLLLENSPSLGIFSKPYPEVCFALGTTYKNLQRYDDALKAWEDGVSKCISMYSILNSEGKGNFWGMLEGMVDIYEKRGQQEYANRIRTITRLSDTKSIEYVGDLISKALDFIQKSRAEEALNLLNEAEILLPKTNEPDYQLLYDPIYSRKAQAYAKKCNLDETLRHLKN